MINNIFYDLIAEGIIIVYLNDILIFTQILEKYHRVDYRVLKILAEHKLFFCLKKYKFDKWQIKYLGLVIFKNQVKMNSVKVFRVCDWPILQIVLICRYFPVSPTFTEDLSMDFQILHVFCLISLATTISRHGLPTNKMLLIC